MIDKKSFKKAIAAPLEKAGFKKTGQSWYLSGTDTIVTLGLQKSDWSELYFIQVDIQLPSLQGTQHLSKGDYLFSHRLERLFPNKQDIIQKGTSLDTGDTDSLNALSEFIEKDVVSFLLECTSIDNLRKKLRSGTFNNGLISKKAKELLS